MVTPEMFIIPIGTKSCACCFQYLPLAMFSPVKRRGRLSLHSYCKACRVMQQTERNKERTGRTNEPPRENVWPRLPWEADADNAFMAWREVGASSLTGLRL
ncbi:MAG: hypothetical protein M3R16_02265 [Pseudomonadota bacterium]|nr:hypothetical protein [Pseudomonadota bacterium]